jgi:hypothetical protein
MKVGDLIQDNEYGDIGLVLEINQARRQSPYRVLYVWFDGKKTIQWFSKDYVEKGCEVLC